MDWINPLRSIAATVDVDVLQVLGRTHAAVTGNQLAQLAGRSYAQVHAVVGRLVEHGLVDVEQHGRTYTYSLNRDHVLAAGLLEMLGAAHFVEEAIVETVRGWSIRPRIVAIFGSAARRIAGADSDLDLLLIREDQVAADDATWAEQTHALVRQLERKTGNSVQLLELSVLELNEAIRSRQPLVDSLREEARTLIGEDLRALLTSRADDAEK